MLLKLFRGLQHGSVLMAPTLPPHFLVLSCISPDRIYLQDATWLLLLTTPRSSVVYIVHLIDNEQQHRQRATLPLKKSRFSIHKVLESRLTSATVFSRLLLSPALLICSREKPGHRHGRSQGAELRSPPPHTHRHTLQVPMGQRQINRKDASAAIGALAQRELLPLSTVRAIKGSLLKLKKSVLWS